MAFREKNGIGSRVKDIRELSCVPHFHKDNSPHDVVTGLRYVSKQLTPRTKE